MAVLGGYGALQLLVTPAAPGDGVGRTIAGIVMALLVPLGIALIVRGGMRLRWWRESQAEARRRGIPLPDKLTGTGT